MPKKQWTDETETITTNIKRGFDDQIVKEYVLAFRDSHRHDDGRHLPEDVIWGRLTETLGIEGATKWRFETGKLANNAGPRSPIDGRHERYRPGLADVFRYIAATDIAVETIGFPRGRVIVNRATARALSGIRRLMTGQDHPITPVEVERLRFLRHWAAEDPRKTGFTAQTVAAMLAKDIPDQMMGKMDLSDQFIRSLHRLYADWHIAWTTLAGLIPYDWLRF